MSTFYVYEHWRPDKGVCFYVGKGRGRRAWNLAKRNFLHRAIVSKLTSLGLAVDIRLIKQEISEEEAFVLEKERIAFYGRDRLVNLTDGGDGTAGVVINEEQRAKRRLASLGRKMSPEARAKISAARMGMKFSDEHRAKLSAHAKRRGAPVLDEVARLKISQSKKGKARSPETIAKMKESLKGRVISAEQRIVISIRHKGKITPSHVRGKMAQARKAWWARKKEAI